MTDPVADMLTRIRNAQAVRKAEVLLPYSKFKFSIAEILKKEGFIEEVEKIENSIQGNIRITLKYVSNSLVIRGLKKISKPGRRIYIKKTEIRPIRNKQGIAIISSSAGLLTDKQASKKGVGGEFICEVW
ncbi:30S ribosomal protein S8 [bacterium (Candidatus Torokbacteria) CG_4_10_14_0_2_um_filter_35_8]|nr:MAG: 30S ribosomal protein S8 [bacterium (Candidatus Torokbacteria) CG_4_10_14_0_2_um_filter_35_8]